MNLIEHLPRASFFWEAYWLDEDIAELLARTDPAPHSERMSEWTPERDAIAHLCDLVSNLAVVLININGGKASRPPVFERPRTAAEQFRARRDAETYRDLVERITPDR